MVTSKVTDKTGLCIRSSDGKKFLRVSGDPVNAIIEKKAVGSRPSDYVWCGWGKSPERNSYPSDLDPWQRDSIIETARIQWKKDLVEKNAELDDTLKRFDSLRKKLEALHNGLVPEMQVMNVNSRGWTMRYYRADDLPDPSGWVDSTSLDQDWLDHVENLLDSAIKSAEYSIGYLRRDINNLSKSLNDPLEWVSVKIRTEVLTDIVPI